MNSKMISMLSQGPSGGGGPQNSTGQMQTHGGNSSLTRATGGNQGSYPVNTGPAVYQSHHGGAAGAHSQ